MKPIKNANIEYFLEEIKNNLKSKIENSNSESTYWISLIENASLN